MEFLQVSVWSFSFSLANDFLKLVFEFFPARLVKRILQVEKFEIVVWRCISVKFYKSSTSLISHISSIYRILVFQKIQLCNFNFHKLYFPTSNSNNFFSIRTTNVVQTARWVVFHLLETILCNMKKWAYLVR